MSHTTSKTWVSEETKEFETWTRIRDSMIYVAPRSPFVPTTFKEWLSHKVSRKEEDRHKIAQKLVTKQGKLSQTEGRANNIFRGKRLGDQLGLVLAAETIWKPSPEPKDGRQNACWPSHENISTRETTEQRRPLEQYSFDEVGKRMVNSSNGEAEIDVGSVVDLIGRSFLRDIEFGKTL
ncbi:hypothetical protein FQN49_001792 [Arthroderma sp. PD_2]|nr:hypothetical protein FQN49_001792 [Arthroderma sp. PD_2]